MNSGEYRGPTGSEIIAIPFPGRGHVNPMINFCSLLSAKGITVNLILTEEWLGLIGSIDGSANLHLHSIPNVIPSESIRAANYLEFFEAVYTKMEDPFEKLLDRFERPPACIIADMFLPWTMAVGSRRNIPVVSVIPTVPSLLAFFHQIDLLAAHGHYPGVNLEERGEDIIDYIPGVSVIHLADLPRVLVEKSKISKYILEAHNSVRKTHAVLFTSFYEIQDNVINSLRKTLPIPIYTVGPSIPYTFLKRDIIDPRHTSISHWLDSHSRASVLYVSLGSFLSTSEEQMLELLTGLCDSGVKFLLVARTDKTALQESCGDNGLMIPWCDQLRVLCHSSVGGFLTHCGWNSTMESMFAGVPMLTFPLAADQILNSKLIVEDWKIGLRLKERTSRQENVIRRKEIGEKVKRLMNLNSEESKEIRKRVEELQQVCCKAIEIGGSSYNCITSFVKDFVQDK